jgi:hypothetical protein
MNKMRIILNTLVILEMSSITTALAVESSGDITFIPLEQKIVKPYTISWIDSQINKTDFGLLGKVDHVIEDSLAYNDNGVLNFHTSEIYQFDSKGKLISAVTTMMLPTNGTLEEVQIDYDKIERVIRINIHHPIIGEEQVANFEYNLNGLDNVTIRDKGIIKKTLR